MAGGENAHPEIAELFRFVRLLLSVQWLLSGQSENRGNGPIARRHVSDPMMVGAEDAAGGRCEQYCSSQRRDVGWVLAGETKPAYRA
jgi:hypothetical protein